MKNLFLALALTTFVGSMATTAYAAVTGTEVVKKFDDKKKKKKKKKKVALQLRKDVLHLKRKHVVLRKLTKKLVILKKLTEFQLVFFVSKVLLPI